MPPNATSAVECTGVLDECDAETVDGALDKNIVELKHAHARELKLVWRNIILFAVVHLSAVYGLWLAFTSARLYTSLFGKKLILICCFIPSFLCAHFRMNQYFSIFVLLQRWDYIWQLA